MIYLPALGSIAIKGEEGRRILPAIRMLETGNYIVPQVGSNPYYRKPPLVNWLLAASFETFGVRNEWTARLPSVVSVLAVAIAFVIVARASLTPKGSMLAALIWMTNIGIIEKGRLIEIEALYVSLFGLAIILWLSFFLQKKSPWLTWLPASVFLGLGLLAKGPTHLLFFYVIVIAVLAYWKDWRVLILPAHLVARVVMGNRGAVSGGQSCPRRARPLRHAGNSSSIMATRHDLRRQRVAMAATLDERRTRLDQGRRRVRWAGNCDWCDRLSGYGG